MEIASPCVQIGGTGIPIDKTALLIASSQSGLVWWLPAVVIAGVSIVFLKSRRKSK